MYKEKSARHQMYSMAVTKISFYFNLLDVQRVYAKRSNFVLGVQKNFFYHSLKLLLPCNLT